MKAVGAVLCVLVAWTASCAAEETKGAEPKEATVRQQSPEAALAAVQQFLARHIAGKTFCKPQATYVIDNGRVEGVHAVTIWYHPVKPQTPLEFAWARTSRVTESLYPLDAAGKRSGPPQVRDRTLRGCMQFSARLSTGQVGAFEYTCDENGTLSATSRFGARSYIVDAVTDKELRMRSRESAPYTEAVTAGGGFKPVQDDIVELFLAGGINGTAAPAKRVYNASVYNYDPLNGKRTSPDRPSSTDAFSACVVAGQAPPPDRTPPMRRNGSEPGDAEFEFLQTHITGRTFASPEARFNITSQGVSSVLTTTNVLRDLQGTTDGFSFDLATTTRQTNQDIGQDGQLVGPPRVEDRVSSSRCQYAILQSTGATFGVCMPANPDGTPYVARFPPSKPGAVRWPFVATTSTLHLVHPTLLEMKQLSAWPHRDLFGRGPLGVRLGLEAADITFEALPARGGVRRTRVVRGYSVDPTTFEATKTEELAPVVAYGTTG